MSILKGMTDELLFSLIGWGFTLTYALFVFIFLAKSASSGRETTALLEKILAQFTASDPPQR